MGDVNDFRTFGVAIANLGGVGFIAWCLLHLHKDAIKAFREELTKEREVFSSSRDSDRTERIGLISSHRLEANEKHAAIMHRLESIEEEIREVKNLVERGT